MAELKTANIKKLSTAFNFDYISVKKKKDIDKKINFFLKSKKNIILEVLVDSNQPIAPKQVFIKSKKGIGTPSGLDRMFPFIDYKRFIDF